MAAKRARGGDDHVCPAVEAYLLTYADMITSLLVLFIVLFAMGQIDLVKFEKFKNGIARSGATPIDDGFFENGDGVFEQAMVRPEVISSADDADSEGSGGTPTESEATEGPEGATTAGAASGGGQGAADEAAFEKAQAQITAALEGIANGQDVHFRVETRGLIITIVSDQVLFAPGSASLTTDGFTVVDALAAALVDLPNDLTIEGHTDSRPISTARFPSNWELSVGRSSTVLRALADRGVPNHRLSAAGYADQHPVATNETAVGRAANRRVEVVVHSLDVPDPSFGGA